MIIRTIDITVMRQMVYPFSQFPNPMTHFERRCLILWHRSRGEPMVFCGGLCVYFSVPPPPPGARSNILLTRPPLPRLPLAAMEVNQPKHRAATGILIFLPWAFCVIALGGYGYLLRDWRWLSFTLALPALLFLPALWSVRCVAVMGSGED